MFGTRPSIKQLVEEPCGGLRLRLCGTLSHQQQCGAAVAKQRTASPTRYGFLIDRLRWSQNGLAKHFFTTTTGTSAFTVGVEVWFEDCLRNATRQEVERERLTLINQVFKSASGRVDEGLCVLDLLAGDELHPSRSTLQTGETKPSGRQLFAGWIRFSSLDLISSRKTSL